MSIKTRTRIVTLLIGFAALVTWFIPLPIYPQIPPLHTVFGMHMTVGISLFYTLILMQTTGLFLAGLRNFKDTLRDLAH